MARSIMFADLMTNSGMCLPNGMQSLIRRSSTLPIGALFKNTLITTCK